MKNSSEENLQRGTYLVTDKEKLKPSCKTSTNAKLAKPATKPVTGKAKKVVVSKKKLSPVSGNCNLH